MSPAASDFPEGARVVVHYRNRTYAGVVLRTCRAQVKVRCFVDRTRSFEGWRPPDALEPWPGP